MRNYRIGRFPDAILAADRYLALYPDSKEAAYVLYLKGNVVFRPDHGHHA